MLRTGFRLPRPRAEWETLVRTARALLAPRRGQSCNPVHRTLQPHGLGCSHRGVTRLAVLGSGRLAAHGSRRPPRSRTAGPLGSSAEPRPLGARSAQLSSLPEAPRKLPTPLPTTTQAPGGTLLTTDVSSAHSLVAAALLPLSQRRPPLGEVRFSFAYHLHPRIHAGTHPRTHARSHAVVHARVPTHPHTHIPIGQAVLRREFCGSFGRVEVVAEPVHAFDEPEIQLRAHAA